MMKTLKHILSAGTLALSLLVLAACDTGTPANANLEDDNLNALVADLTESLDLSGTDAQQLTKAFADHEGKDPGYLWHVAADLQATLTADQKAKLLEGRQGRSRFGQGRRNGEGRPDGGHGRARGPRMGDGQGRFGSEGGPLDDLLTEAQKEAIQTLRTSFRADMKALSAQRETLEHEAFRAQMHTLRQTLRDEIQALLTAEQQATLEARHEEKAAARQARMEADRAVAAEVLGLTASQQTALEALRTAQQAARQARREQGRNGEGSVDREALQAQREAHQAALAEILDADQLETVQLHNALASKRHRGKRGGKGMHGQGGRRHG